MTAPTRAMSACVAFDFRYTLTSTRPRTSLAAPVVAWTIGMNTPRTSRVTSTEASAAKLGTALRVMPRSASRRKKPNFTG